MSCSVDIFLFRQVVILIGACLHNFAAGVMLAFPAVLNQDILSTTPNSTDIIATTSQASWIASINGITGTMGCMLLPFIFQIYGRKAANIAMNFFMAVGWIGLSQADSVTTLLIARAIQGFSVGGVYLAALTISEYSTPSRRGYFMTLKIVSLGSGSLACHSLAFLFSWRQISAISVIPLILSTILVIVFWPESPAFLAMKGRFDQCEKAFNWLHGNSARNKRELKELVRAQAERLEKNKETEKGSSFKKYLKLLKNESMLKACFIVTLTILCIDASGRYFLLAYMPTILSEITGSQPIAMYCSIASDIMLVLARALSCLVIKSGKRRTLLFGLGAATVGLMFLIGLVIFIKSKYNMITDITWLIPSLILLHSFLIHIGIIPVAFTVSSEVFPLEHRGICSCISGMIFTLFYAATLKFTPLMLESTGVSGTYAIYALLVAFSLSVLYIILPETKDRTLQDIEDEIKQIERSIESDELLEQNVNK